MTENGSTLGSFRANDEAIVSEKLRLAELMLDQMMQVAAAADMRAVLMAGTFGAAAAAILAAGATLYSTEHRLPLSLLISACVAAVLLLAAAVMCYWAARPRDWHVSGHEPRILDEHIVTNDLTEMRRAILPSVQDRIDANRGDSYRTARMVNRGAILAVSAIPCAGIAWAVVRGLV